ncbi:MAG: phenylacetate--CoA ligase family protein [Phycisphaerales bacterium]|nr:phenylacetate--CoA ligase family protein [Phycisphaerales bacterium]
MRLPSLMQNWVCSLEGWRLRRNRLGPYFRKALEEAERHGNWTHEQTIAYRDRRLAEYIQHCADSVPYYQRMFQRLGIDPRDITTLADLERVPILTKADVRENFADLLSTKINPRQRVFMRTGGTTGSGLRFVATEESLHRQFAVWWRYRRWHDLPFDVWHGYFGGRPIVPLRQTRPPFWRYNRPGRQILFSGYHISPDTIGYYIDELRRCRPPWLHGYPSLLVLLASYILESGQTLGYPLRWITVGSESLLEQQVDLIRQVFGITPVQHYGMSEAVANISQCPCGRLHVDEDFAATEFVPLDDGQGYRVVGTGFTNLAMPFVRYDVGDVVELDDRLCDCGRPGRIVRSIDGRKEDYVILRNGARVGRMAHIFKDFENIREAQLYQDTPGVLHVRVVRGANYTAHDESMLLRKFRERFGDEAEIRIEYVERLPRSATGKLRFVVSEIQEGQIYPVTGIESICKSGQCLQG